MTERTQADTDLRDKLARDVMLKVVDTLVAEDTPLSNTVTESIARVSYRLADAMMAARAK